MKVSVYRNLHKGCFSIRSCEGPTKGLVIAHADDVVLTGVVFHVGKMGQHKVRRTGHKNVHAFVTGHLMGWGGPNAYAYGAGEAALAPSLCGSWNGDAVMLARRVEERGERFTYNPYQHDGFVSKITGHIIHTASRALLSTTRGNLAEITWSEAT